VCIQCGVCVFKTMLWKRPFRRVGCMCVKDDALETSCAYNVVYVCLRRCFGNVVCIQCGLCVFKTMLWKRPLHTVRCMCVKDDALETSCAYSAVYVC